MDKAAEIREAFRSFLAELDSDKANRWLSITDFGLKVALQAVGELRENQEVYDVTDLERVNGWRDKMRSEPVWVSIDRQQNHNLSKALRVYAQFVEKLDLLHHSSKGLKPAKPLMSESDYEEPEPGIKVSKSSQTILISGEMKEGDATEVVSTRYERSRLARQLCIEAYGNTYKCEVCGTKLADIYGSRENKEDYIEVHHIVEHAKRSRQEGAHAVNYRKEMIPLCPNCHRMIHFLKDHTISPDELKELIHANERKK